MSEIKQRQRKIKTQSRNIDFVLINCKGKNKGIQTFEVRFAELIRSIWIKIVYDVDGVVGERG